MQQEATPPQSLTYGRQAPRRRWLWVAFFLGGGIGQFVLFLDLWFGREVRWIDRSAWVLEWPLFRIMWALGLPVTGSNAFVIGLMNGLCCSATALVIVWLVRPARRAA